MTKSDRQVEAASLANGLAANADADEEFVTLVIVDGVQLVGACGVRADDTSIHDHDVKFITVYDATSLCEARSMANLIKTVLKRPLWAEATNIDWGTAEHLIEAIIDGYWAEDWPAKVETQDNQTKLCIATVAEAYHYSEQQRFIRAESYAVV